MNFFQNIPLILYEGPASKNPYAFKFYNPNRLILGKKMRDHLKFSMTWWHTLCNTGNDMFGSGVSDKTLGVKINSLDHALRKVDAGFEIMDKLGIDYFCAHDLDLVPESDNISVTNNMLEIVTDYIKEKCVLTGKKMLWGTANLFSNPRYVNGAASSNSAEVYAFAAAQVKAALDFTVKLGGSGFVFWGGREGYETLLNTKTSFEITNIARLMKMAINYGRSIGFKGDFYIEPKPKEPMKHQYDYDAATSIGFLRHYGLDSDFKLNIEANHATLAGHTFQHELRIAADANMLGSIDANQGDLLLGWDTDEFPHNVYDVTMAMYEILQAGGMKNGGINFDAKNRRSSYEWEDTFYSYILAMDTFALGLIKAAKLIYDGRIKRFLEDRYSSFNHGIGYEIVSGKATLESLSEYAENLGQSTLPGSGRQEYLQSIVNQVLFSKDSEDLS